MIWMGSAVPRPGSERGTAAIPTVYAGSRTGGSPVPPVP